MMELQLQLKHMVSHILIVISMMIAWEHIIHLHSVSRFHHLLLARFIVGSTLFLRVVLLVSGMEFYKRFMMVVAMSILNMTLTIQLYIILRNLMKARYAVKVNNMFPCYHHRDN